MLRRATVEDAEVLWSLMIRNRDRLTDWSLPPEFSLGDFISDYVEKPPYDRVTYGLWEGNRLHGTISLTPVTPAHWSIGYFLDSESTGRGLATSACRALAPVARDCGAADLYAIVVTGNEKSCAVLQRAGYEMIQQLGDRTRWWLPLRENPEPPVMA